MTQVLPQIQVRFTTNQRQYIVTDSAILVPTNLRRYGLSEIINHLLGTEKPIPFDFMINGEFLRSSLDEYLKIAGLSTETTLTLEYVESILPPRELSAFQHDDWISSVKIEQSMIVTGSYDNKIRIWNTSGECKQTFSGHDAPVKSIDLYCVQGERTICVSASQDRTVRAWSILEEDYNDRCGLMYECRGHKGSVECVRFDAHGNQVASASADSTINLWNTLPPDEDELVTPETSHISREKPEIYVKKPEATLLGHTGPVQAIVYDDEYGSNRLYSGGWDHSVRMWDVESRVNVDTKNSDKVILCIAYSDVNLTKITLSSHQNWVSSLTWSPVSAYILASASYDGTLKIWDIRSKTPLYTLSQRDNSKKLFCVDWNNGIIVSGGEDCQLRVYSGDKIHGESVSSE
ncbi:8581_t:CDS:2 [Paraglomus brasilianum]|uniref:Ribosome biogenesis protein YTM1 n=1 Tax=Paraglomus brasilianum TaxID=144538 RepID=A0A9N8WKX2_9GLOM|nr:8581_t:CDS:2 [Paraglomus brasilianum]